MKEPERFATPEFPAHQSYVTDEFPYDCIGKMKGFHNLDNRSICSNHPFTIVFTQKTYLTGQIHFFNMGQ